jgi:hypothetical protein
LHIALGKLCIENGIEPQVIAVMNVGRHKE